MKSITFRVPDEIGEALDAIARLSRNSMSDLVREAIQDHIELKAQSGLFDAAMSQLEKDIALLGNYQQGG